MRSHCAAWLRHYNWLSNSRIALQVTWLALVHFITHRLHQFGIAVCPLYVRRLAHILLLPWRIRFFAPLIQETTIGVLLVISSIWRLSFLIRKRDSTEVASFKFILRWCYFLELVFELYVFLVSHLLLMILPQLFRNHRTREKFRRLHLAIHLVFRKPFFLNFDKSLA